MTTSVQSAPSRFIAVAPGHHDTMARSRLVIGQRGVGGFLIGRASGDMGWTATFPCGVEHLLSHLRRFRGRFQTRRSGLPVLLPPNRRRHRLANAAGLIANRRAGDSNFPTYRSRLVVNICFSQRAAGASPLFPATRHRQTAHRPELFAPLWQRFRPHGVRIRW